MIHDDYYEGCHNVSIKMYGDGAKYSRSSQHCLLSFSILRKNECSLNPFGNKRTFLAIYLWNTINFHVDLRTTTAIKGGENHENLAISGLVKCLVTSTFSYISSPQVRSYEKEYTLDSLCDDYKVCNYMMITDFYNKYDHVQFMLQWWAWNVQIVIMTACGVLFSKM